VRQALVVVVHCGRTTCEDEHGVPCRALIPREVDINRQVRWYCGTMGRYLITRVKEGRLTWLRLPECLVSAERGNMHTEKGDPFHRDDRVVLPKEKL